MLDRSLPLTILDYDEFGDPRDQDDYETIRSYSPYDNISPCVCYPSMLITASFHDSRFAKVFIYFDLFNLLLFF